MLNVEDKEQDRNNNMKCVDLPNSIPGLGVSFVVQLLLDSPLNGWCKYTRFLGSSVECDVELSKEQGVIPSAARSWSHDALVQGLSE